jgi:hypothetical protein
MLCHNRQPTPKVLNNIAQGKLAPPWVWMALWFLHVERVPLDASPEPTSEEHDDDWQVFSATLVGRDYWRIGGLVDRKGVAEPGGSGNATRPTTSLD